MNGTFLRLAEEFEWRSVLATNPVVVGGGFVEGGWKIDRDQSGGGDLTDKTQ